MKARVFVSALLVLLLFSGCKKKQYELPWDSFCYRIQPSQELSLEKKDREIVIDLLNNGNWTDGLVEADCDFVFYLQAQTVRYDSESGTFLDVTDQKSMTLSESDRILVNAALKP